MPIDYYETQAKLWQIETQKDTKNKVAWYNYYSAARAYNALSKSQNMDLNQITEDLVAAIPNTFESEFIQFWNGNWEKENRVHLKKAHELSPERSEAYRDLMLLYLLEQDAVQAQLFAQKLYESGAYSAGLVNWSYNQLMSVEDGSILFTAGDNDTFFAMMLQLYHKIKPGVKVINPWLLQVEDFQANTFAQLQIPPLEKTQKDYKDKAAFRLAIIEHILAHTNQTVYFGTGSGLEKNKDYRSKLFQVGLAYRYSEDTFNNFAHLQNNIENHFLIDYLKQDLKIDQGVSVVRSMNQHYLSPLLMLYAHYQDSGALQKAEKLKILIQKVAAQGDNLAAVEAYLEN